MAEAEAVTVAPERLASHETPSGESCEITAESPGDGPRVMSESVRAGAAQLIEQLRANRDSLPNGN
jgi:hypothetical protein